MRGGVDKYPTAPMLFLKAPFSLTNPWLKIVDLVLLKTPSSIAYKASICL